MSKDGARLRELRAERQLSLREVEERGGPAKDVMSLTERGLNKPTAKTIGKIAVAFDMSVSELQAELLKANHPEGLPLPPTPEWALLAPGEEFDEWIEMADAMALHRFFVRASKFSRGIQDTERRAHLLWRAQLGINEFFRRFPVKEIIDKRPRAAGEPGEKKSKGA